MLTLDYENASLTVVRTSNPLGMDSIWLQLQITKITKSESPVLPAAQESNGAMGMVEYHDNYLCDYHTSTLLGTSHL